MKIITTIGTSLVTNVIKNLSNDEKLALDAFSKLQQKDYKEKSKYQKEYDVLKGFILDKVEFSERTSAEIKSLINIAKDPKFQKHYLEVVPIATDTLLAPMCAEVLKVLIEKNLDINVDYSKQYIIEDLQVSDYKRYKNGLINLLNKLNSFSNEELVLNITGGFKGVIPYMTIYGQVNSIPLFYIFEFTSSLIEIPQIPLTINYNIFEKEWETFYKIDSEEIVAKDTLSYQFLKDYENILDIEGDLVSLNPLGKILWDKYRKENFIFYATDEVWQEIQKLKNIQNILKTKFLSTYTNKTEQKNNHFVYDDGNNPNRIFYFEEDNKFYIYKVFENHEKYEEYLNKNSFSKDIKQQIIAKTQINKL